jgi:hypothetical protein
MLREVGKIYSRAFRMMFKSPSRFLGLSILYSFVSRILLVVNKSLPDLAAIAVDLIRIGIGIFLGMLFIFTIYQSENLIEAMDIVPKIKKYFWRFVEQSLVGFLIIFLYTFPVFCLMMFAVYFDGMLLVVPFWLLIVGFLSLGSVSLGQRILLDTGTGIYKSSTEGFRILNENLKFFISLYFVTLLIFAAITFLRIVIGSAMTGMSIFSVPFFPISKFWGNVVSIANNPLANLFATLVGIFTFPLNAIVHTLAYLRCKNQSPLPEPTAEN